MSNFQKFTNKSLSSEIINVRDIKVASVEKISGQKNANVTLVGPNGETIYTHNRFWKSFNRMYGVNDQLYRLFDRHEVFERVAEVHGGQMRLTTEQDLGTGRVIAMSATDTQKTVLDSDRVLDVLFSKGAVNVAYQHGVITGFLNPTEDEESRDLTIGPDTFRQRHYIEIPVDGFGLPEVTLSLLRLVCMNGMVAMDRFFTSGIKIGENSADGIYVLDRYLRSFANEKGFDILLRRMEAAQNSVASLYEVENMKNTLVKAGVEHKFQKPLDQEQSKILRRYGIATVEHMTDKARRLIATDLTVYDLFNIATEISSHHLDCQTKKDMVLSSVGRMMVNEYDREGLEGKKDQYQALFFSRAA